MPTIAQRLNDVRTKIRQTEARAGRTPGSVRLLAVSKTRPLADLQAAIAAGQTAFGESYVQEAVAKITALAGQGLEWHFIGPIQSNKTAQIAEHFAWVHSVERAKIARRLHEQRPASAAPLNVCIQVNISGESSKAGIDPAGLTDLAAQIACLSRLRLRGLMCIPAPETDPARQRRPFRALRELFEQLCQAGFAMDTLSMGMTDDLEAAILEGATMVRIGTAIFGARG